MPRSWLGQLLWAGTCSVWSHTSYACTKVSRTWLEPHPTIIHTVNSFLTSRDIPGCCQLVLPQAVPRHEGAGSTSRGIMSTGLWSKATLVKKGRKDSRGCGQEAPGVSRTENCPPLSFNYSVDKATECSRDCSMAPHA